MHKTCKKLLAVMLVFIMVVTPVFAGPINADAPQQALEDIIHDLAQQPYDSSTGGLAADVEELITELATDIASKQETAGNYVQPNGSITVNFPGVEGVTVRYSSNVSGWQVAGTSDNYLTFILPDEHLPTWGALTVQASRGNAMVYTFQIPVAELAENPTVLYVPVLPITVTGVDSALDIGVAVSSTGNTGGWVYNMIAAEIGEPAVYNVFDNGRYYNIHVRRAGYIPFIFTDRLPGDTICLEAEGIVYTIEIPASITNIRVSNANWVDLEIEDGNMTLFKNYTYATFHFHFHGVPFVRNFMLDGSNPLAAFDAAMTFSVNVVNNGNGVNFNQSLENAGLIRIWMRLGGVNTDVDVTAISAYDQDGNDVMQFVRISRPGGLVRSIDVMKHAPWRTMNLSVTVYGQTLNIQLINNLFFSINTFNNGTDTQVPSLAGTIRMWTQLGGTNALIPYANLRITAVDQDGACALEFITVNRIWNNMAYVNHINANKNAPWQTIDFTATLFGQTVRLTLINNRYFSTTVFSEDWRPNVNVQFFQGVPGNTTQLRVTVDNIILYVDGQRANIRDFTGNVAPHQMDIPVIHLPRNRGWKELTIIVTEFGQTITHTFTN